MHDHAHINFFLSRERRHSAVAVSLCSTNWPRSNASWADWVDMEQKRKGIPPPGAWGNRSLVGVPQEQSEHELWKVQSLSQVLLWQGHSKKDPRGALCLLLLHWPRADVQAYWDIRLPTSNQTNAWRCKTSAFQVPKQADSWSSIRRLPTCHP